MFLLVAVHGHVVVRSGRSGLRSPFLGVGVLPPPVGRLGGRGGVPSCPALRRGCASWLIDYTMGWNIKLVH